MADIQIAVIDEKDTQIALAVPGIQGPAGAISSGGSANQVFYKVSGTNYDAGWTFIGNANVDAAAAIAGTKISPNFGSQAIVTTGTNTAASFIPTSSSIPSNGIYLPGANQVGVATNGTGRLFIDASGNVGVNTASPSTYGKFAVVDTQDGFSSSTFVNTSNGVSAVKRIQIGNDASNGAGQLVVYGSQHSTLANIFDVNNANAAALRLLTNNTERARIRSDGTFEIKGAGTAGSSPGFSVNPSTPANSFVIDSSGRLGIGTSSPGVKFEVLDSISSTSSCVSKLFNAYNNFDANATTSYPLLFLERAGKSGATFGSTATFGIARYENAGAAARTRLDIQLGHGNVATPDTNVMSLLSSGNVGIGTAASNANGGVLQLSSGITFPATAVAASDPNTLDDYEEGTWTPTLAFTGGNTGITYDSFTAGNYTKVGRLVVCHGTLKLSSKGSSTGDVRIGLPITPANVFSNYAASSIAFTAGITYLGTYSIYVEGGNAWALLQSYTTVGAKTLLNDTNLTNAAECTFTITYTV